MIAASDSSQLIAINGSLRHLFDCLEALVIDTASRRDHRYIPPEGDACTMPGDLWMVHQLHNLID